VVLADAEEVDADLVGKDALFDDVADRLGMRLGTVGLVVGQIAERVQPEDERKPRPFDSPEPRGLRLGRAHVTSLPSCAEADA
jgi:hypothetical protein